MDAAFRARLEQVYSVHPLSADAVLDRVCRDRGTLDGVRARDLAEAPHGGPTDQNHMGGAAVVRDLAAAVGLRAGWRVLDIGTGLGGTPRLLAEEFGCRCHGVELTAARFHDAVRLTQLVGLQDRVTFSHGDFMTVALPAATFDLAVGQGAFIHFPDIAALLGRIQSLLRDGGRLVMEDGLIGSAPQTPEHMEALDRLFHIWNGRFYTQSHWADVLDRSGFRIDRIDDLTTTGVAEFERLLTQAAAGRLGPVQPDERHGWELGLRLLRSGHLGMGRIVATLIRPLVPAA